jgi:CheY-like chemotaxis protein
LGRVLIVDDDPATCTTFAAALRLEGLTVRTVHTGADAIAAATTQSFDLALIDLRLPDMPGTDVVREVRTAGHDCPFILMSGFLEPPFIVEAMRLGAHDVWPKPVWIEDLCRNVCALVLDRERQRSESHAPALQNEARTASKDVSDAGTLAERWALMVVKGSESPRDVPTIADWAQVIAVSYSGIRDTCDMLGIPAHRSRNLVRAIRAVRLARPAAQQPPGSLLEYARCAHAENLPGRWRARGLGRTAAHRR